MLFTLSLSLSAFTCTLEQLVPGEYSEPKRSWEEDLDAMVPPVLEDKQPCYIFYRLDERNAHQNFLWVFMSYTPDFAPVSVIHHDPFSI